MPDKETKNILTRETLEKELDLEIRTDTAVEKVSTSDRTVLLKNGERIAYDRLLMQSDAVSYYATFDNWLVGTKQGEYIEEALGLKEGKGPFNIEFITGDPGDNNINFFFDGAISVLQPYIDAGKIVVTSGQVEFDQVATPTWKTDVAQKRAEDILTANYAGGENIDVWLCSNDSTALGVTNALEANYGGENWPIITGQDAELMATKNIISGHQTMSIAKDTRTLAEKCVTMVNAVLTGSEPEINDTTTYDNGVFVVPSYLCTPVAVDANNYQAVLVDTGYYTSEELANYCFTN